MLVGLSSRRVSPSHGPADGRAVIGR